MKFSLLFLSLVLLWAALIVDMAWVEYPRCEDLRNQLDVAKTKTTNFTIPTPLLQAPDKLADAKQNIEPYKKQFGKLSDEFKRLRLAELDLKSISSDSAVVGRVQYPSTEFNGSDAFKVLIPEHRNVEIRAEFKFPRSERTNVVKRFKLPSGEYALEVNCDQSRTENYFREIKIAIDFDGNETPFEWTEHITFYPNTSSVDAGLYGIEILNPSQTPLTLASHSQSKNQTNQRVDFSVALVDVTSND